LLQTGNITKAIFYAANIFNLIPGNSIAVLAHLLVPDMNTF
jgi:hypothetical protein